MATTEAPTASTTKRLLNEIATYQQDPDPANLRLGPIDEANLLHWEAILLGEPGTAYEGGRWKLDIRIPPTYPHLPPAIRFLTPICHANVHFKTGEICLDLLRSSWSPAYTIAATVAAIHQLLAYPEPESPLNVDVAALLRAGDLIGAEGLIRWCCGEWRWEDDERMRIDRGAVIEKR